MSLIWHNAVFKKDGPVFAAHDRLRLGEGVFDVMPAVDGRLCYADLHFSKLLRAGDVFFGSWEPPALEILENAAHELLKRNGFDTGHYGIRTLITRGPAGEGIRLPQNIELQVVMRAGAMPKEFPPVHAVIAQSARRNEGSPLSRIKCANYGENILALREAEEKGANDAILLNNAGFVACATTSNIFVVRGGKLFTPPLAAGCQEGVTRKLIIEKYGAREENLKPEDLSKVEGIYFTNSGRGVTAIKTLDGKDVPAPSVQIDKGFHLGYKTERIISNVTA